MAVKLKRLHFVASYLYNQTLETADWKSSTFSLTISHYIYQYQKIMLLSGNLIYLLKWSYRGPSTSSF